MKGERDRMKGRERQNGRDRMREREVAEVAGLLMCRYEEICREHFYSLPSPSLSLPLGVSVVSLWH